MNLIRRVKEAERWDSAFICWQWRTRLNYQYKPAEFIGHEFSVMFNVGKMHIEFRWITDNYL